jgi:hypothetical protein
MKFKSLVFVFSIFVLSQSLKAEVLLGNYELKSSKINYLVTYLIKKADGESTGAKGKGECKVDKCDFLVAAPIKSFESKDSNRDLNMLNTTKAEKYPLVVAKILTPTSITNGVLKADLEIDFSGVKHLYKSIPFTAHFKDGILHVEGKFDLILGEHKIEKPSLLGVNINELVPLTITADWKKL